jgi:hypothetical protein
MAKKETPSAKPSNLEQIGFHKGALSTLAKEREELLRIVGIVENLMQMHVKALQELGVDIAAQAKQFEQKQNRRSIDESL